MKMPRKFKMQKYLMKSTRNKPWAAVFSSNSLYVNDKLVMPEIISDFSSIN